MIGLEKRMQNMNGYIKLIKAGILAGLLVAGMAMPAYALKGSMGPARMTLHTELPFMSPGGGVIEVPIRVVNTANESERVVFSTTGDLNNSEIMSTEFTEVQLVLMPKEERVVNVTFNVKRPGTFSGNIITMFDSLTEESSSTIASTIELRLNSQVSIVAESKGPDIQHYFIGALGFAAIAVLILGGVILYKGKKSRRKEEQEETENERIEENG